MGNSSTTDIANMRQRGHSQRVLACLALNHKKKGVESAIRGYRQ
jgi:hypothetical protein